MVRTVSCIAPHDRVAGTDVAIKVLAQSRRLSPVAAERLRRELRAAWTVTHPGVVRVHDLIIAGDHLALSMELVDGETLDQRLARTRKLGVPELTTLAADLANALAAAHTAGVTHRDLKPSNIMLRASGGVVITDFGLSRMAGFAEAQLESSADTSDSSDLTRTGELLGTPAFMAPEQLRGAADVGPAADVYAFGLVLFEAATGARAHPHATLPELVAARFDQPPPAVASKRPDLPANLAQVIDQCLLVDLARRIPDAVEVSRRLRSERPAPRPGRRWLAAAGVLALAGAASAWALSRRTAAAGLPAHDRRIVFQVDGDRDLHRALRQLASRRFAATDRRVDVVDDATTANVVVRLSWRASGDGVELTSTLGPPAHPVHAFAPRRAGSLGEAFDLLSPELAALVDAGQRPGHPASD